MRPFYVMDYQCRRWEQKRNKILRRDGYQCQLSKRYGRAVEAEVVHHIFPVSQYPQYEWEDWNLISISKDMHNKLHDRMTDKLSPAGMALLIRTARKHGVKI